MPLTDNTVLTRAVFTKQLIDTLFSDANVEECLGALVYKEKPDYRLLFSDVSINHPQAKEICVAMRLGLVRGYDDVTFRPDQPINFAETAKMLSRAFNLLPYPVNNSRLAWYQPFVDVMIARNVFSKKTKLAQHVTYKDLQGMLQKLR